MSLDKTENGVYNEPMFHMREPDIIFHLLIMAAVLLQNFPILITKYLKVGIFMGIEWHFCLFFSLISVFMDLKWEKVKNLWIYGCWFFIPVYRFFLPEGMNWFQFLGGTLIPVIALFPLFYCRMLGTGDIKVLAVLGGMLGIRRSILCLVGSFLVAAVLALPILIFRCDIRKRFQYFWFYIIQVYKTKTFPPYLAPGFGPENIHFTIPICCSVILLMGGGL